MAKKKGKGKSQGQSPKPAQSNTNANEDAKPNDAATKVANEKSPLSPASVVPSKADLQAPKAMPDTPLINTAPELAGEGAKKKKNARKRNKKKRAGATTEGEPKADASADGEPKADDDGKKGGAKANAEPKTDDDGKQTEKLAKLEKQRLAKKAERSSKEKGQEGCKPG